MNRRLFCGLLLATIFAAPAARGEVAVRGFLISGGDKVAGASVRLAAAPGDVLRFEMAFSHPALAEVARTRSDAGGYFELMAPELGFYQLQVEAEGYLGTDRWVPVLRAASDPAAIELVRARPVLLTVLDPEGRPAAGVRVRLGFQKDGAGRYPTWPLFRDTAADGKLQLQVPQGQDAAAVLVAPGFAATMAPLPAGQTAVEVRLERGSPVEVEVTDPRRRFLPGVVIFSPDTWHEIGRTGRDGKAVVRVAAGQSRLGFTDAEGRYAVAALPPEKKAGEAPAAEAAAGEAPATEAPAAAEPAPRKVRVVLEDPQPIEGRVFELPERAPLAEAWVSLGGAPPHFTRSDRTGYFRLPRFPGRRNLLAVKEGYVPAFADVGGLPVPLDIGLERAATVYGTVSDAAGKPLAGVGVTASAEGLSRSLRSGGRSRTMTDREGRYEIGDLPAGQAAEIEATYELLSAKAAVEPVAAGDRARADLKMPRRQGWSCRVVDPEEKGLPGAEIFVAAARLTGQRLPQLDFDRLQRSGQVRRLGSADAEGRFATTELAAGRYDFAAKASGYAPAWVRGVEVGAGGESGEEEAGAAPSEAPDETIVLRPLVRTHGKVLDENDVALADATLHLSVGSEGGSFHRIGPELPPIVTSGKGGEFSFSGVAEGQRFDLVAGKEGYLSTRASGQGVAEAEEPPPLVVRLSRAGLIEGTVLGDGKPIAYARLRAEPIDLPPKPGDLNWQPLARSDAEGAYTIDRLWPGRYRLVAESRGFRNWQSDTFELRAGERKRIDVELLEAALLAGKVLLPSGEPVEDAWLSLAANSTDRPTSQTEMPTDALGQYRIESAEPGAGWLTVISSRYRRQSRAVDIGPGVNEIDFVLETGSLEIAGRVLDDGGQPVARARVRLSGDSIFREERSGLDGEVRFADLDEGTYRLEVAAPGYLGDDVSLALESSREDLILRLREARSRIVGTIQGLDPPSLSAVRIGVRPAGPGGEAATAAIHGAYGSPGATPDSRGRFAVENLAEGSWLLIASLSGPPARVITQVVEIAEGQEEAEQDLDFGRLAGPWVARLLDAGQPHSGYGFLLAHPDLGPLLQGTGTGDRLELYAPAGTYRLAIFATDVPDKNLELEIEIGAPAEQEVDLAPARP